ncbi:uncharacterized protein LOC134727979 [Mytilus trossulus]|uniref:uncharacterized protein LOC134727979 n=1 Tax=Mytilus trossulus TaxID=6551 RepID=UPI0030073DE0
MAMKYLPMFFVFLTANGFLLDKSQITIGQTGTSNHYITATEFLDETKAIHLEGQQLRRYVDKSLFVLTSELEQKFNILEQILIKCENQSVSNASYESLKHKYIGLERKYNQLQTENKVLKTEQNLMTNELWLLRNKTGEVSNDVKILKHLGNIKPLQEIQTLQLAVKTVSDQAHSLSVNERARSQDFLALYNMTIDSKRSLIELNSNISNRFKTLETKTDKQLLRLELHHNSTTTGIINDMEAMEQHENFTLSVMQSQMKKISERVAMTAYLSSTGTITSTVMKFDNVMFSVGITNLSSYKNTGKFTCEREGLYLISASVMSYTSGAQYYISLNGNIISYTRIGDHIGNNYFTGAVTITRELNPNDQVWLYASGTIYLVGDLYSKLTIIKIK